MNTIKKILLFAAILVAFTQCGKRKQYSHWKVDGKEYSSNNVIVQEYRGVWTLESNDKVRFALVFHGSALPTSGNFKITRTEDLGMGKVSMGICIDTVCYGISPHQTKYVTATINNNKAQYQMAPAWFVKFNNPNDSILVEGTFNEP